MNIPLAPANNITKTISEILAWVFGFAALIAASPSELELLPPELWPWKVKIIAWSGFLTMVSKLINLNAQNKINQKSGGLPIVLLFCFLVLPGCATTTAGLTKDQIAVREARNERWSGIGEGVGKILLNIGVGWVQAQAIESDRGFRK